MWASAPTNVYEKQTEQTTMSALTNMLHHRRTRRCVLHSTAACFAISLRGNCSRWERCLHAGGAVVEICREIFVCWLQCSSTGLFCGTAVQPDSYPAPLFAHFFWRNRKSGSAKQRLRCHCNRGSPVNPDKRADRVCGAELPSPVPTEKNSLRPVAGGNRFYFTAFLLLPLTATIRNTTSSTPEIP